jgi:hypothetical protein
MEIFTIGIHAQNLFSLRETNESFTMQRLAVGVGGQENVVKYRFLPITFNVVELRVEFSFFERTGD